MGLRRLSTTHPADTSAVLTAALHRCWRACACALLLALAGQVALARTVLEFDPAQQPVALADWGDYWIDPTAQKTVQDIAADAALPWQPTLARNIYPLQPQQALWIRFTVPPAPDAERWLLEIPYPAMDRASLYTLDRAYVWREQRSGDLTPVNQWPTPHRHPLLVVNFNAEEPTHYMLRLENVQGFSAPIRFVSSAYVLRGEQQVSLFLGVYFGLALLGLVVGLAGMVLLRDRAYLYYAVCSALVGLTQAAITGVAALHLWPDWPQWADRSLVVLGVWMLMALLILNATIVSLAQRSRPLHRLIWAVVLGGAALSAALLLTDSELRIALVVPYLVLVPVLMLVVNLWAWRRGDRFGGWLLLAAAPLAISLALAIGRYLQWLPLSFVTEQAVLASMALQMPAMLAVLVLRSQHRRENTRRIQGLDRVDPSTGLINESVFAERLSRMIARSERLRHQGAVLMIDLVNSEQIQRDFGRKAAQDLPLRVAERLLSTARDIDSAARLSEHRFSMLVEGPFTAEEAATLGPRIVARCLMPYQGLPVDCVAQVRVAYALVPRQGPTAEIALARLAQTLAGVSPQSKRAVFMMPDYK
ncbi:MAG: 7TM diverse intracellular signaling domain-containing protein [Polaromonas sp.]|uniref:sensor domain-containing diguanylate cyclase n=1 Tax=Polaromonas sp. TaxID=1869339 RepID=UPI00272F1DAA|nr:7TM diverse intracellular signaling domain-containing protein [Polaromonas sp.]MDP2257101.1 7TM diverse intracellular signaling domain-containing protein [Polaromonas sp.]